MVVGVFLHEKILARVNAHARGDGVEKMDFRVIQGRAKGAAARRAAIANQVAAPAGLRRQRE